jgi:hypothetical protein
MVMQTDMLKNLFKATGFNLYSPKSSDKNHKRLIHMSLRAPGRCAALSSLKARLLRFTRNDDAYRWFWDSQNCTLSLQCISKKGRLAPFGGYRESMAGFFHHACPSLTENYG